MEDSMLSSCSNDGWSIAIANYKIQQKRTENFILHRCLFFLLRHFVNLKIIMEIKEALTDDEIIACFPVIMELRPHIQTAEELVTKVKLQTEMGYRLVYIKDEETNKVASICGFRITNYLYTGKTLYIDDLCTSPFARGF